MKYVTLKEVASIAKNAIVDGPFGSSLKTSDYVPEGIPVLQGNNITGNAFNFKGIRFITEHKATELKRSKVVEGDILLVKIGSIGYAAILDNLHGYPYAIIPANLAKISVDKSKVDPNYLVYFLTSDESKRKLINLASKTAQPALSLSKFKDFKVPLPPLAEQIHIAQVLDQADRLRQQDLQLLAHYDQLVQAVFMDMFGTANLESKDWPEVRIADLANPSKSSMRTGPFGSDLLHSEFVDEGIFVLGIDNVVNNRFEWAKPRFITNEKYEKLKRYTVFPGDVLISIMATIGRTAVVPYNVPAAINSKHLAAITLNQELAVPSFISYSLHADPKILQQLASRSKGAIMDGLNLGIIKDTKLNLPPLALQQRFAKILTQIEAQKAATQQLQDQSEALFNSLLQQAFRGELTRPEPAARPAAGQLSLALG